MLENFKDQIACITFNNAEKCNISDADWR